MSSEMEAALWTPPKMSDGDASDPIALLRGVPLFAELKDAQLKKILRLLHERIFHPGEVIFREGERGAGMYIVKRGVVDIVIRLPDGGEKVVATLSDRQFFGEMALLESAPRSASCVARERTELLGFFDPDLDALVERDSRTGARVLWNLARLMAGRIRSMNEAMKSKEPG